MRLRKKNSLHSVVHVYLFRYTSDVSTIAKILSNGTGIGNVLWKNGTCTNNNRVRQLELGIYMYSAGIRLYVPYGG